MISKEDVKYIAKLSMLKLSDEEIENFTVKFDEILDYMRELQEVDTENVKSIYSVSTHYQYFRKDEVEESFSREEIIKNAPEEQFGYFKLPKVLD